MAARNRVAAVTLTHDHSTTAQALLDLIDGTTAAAGNASFGSRIRSLSMVTGPTTAPGGAYIVAILVVDPAAVETVLQVVTLANTADTLQLDEKILPTLTLPPGCTMKAAMRTALASGATVHVSVVLTDNTD